MSRALDPSLKKLLKDGDHEQIFINISGILEHKFDGFLEIEILPKSHPLENGADLLRDGSFIAIPKIRIVQAFFHARQIFCQYLTLNDGVPVETVQRATAVLLLADSEHLTAANVRKRILTRELLSDRDGKGKIERELFFINSLVTSRLHRHTKSPVLWNHKRWLLRRLKQAHVRVHLLHEFTKVILVAAERHSRNYYAWTYARDLFALHVSMHEEVVDQLVPVVMTWCRLHHQDISGWSFLMYLASEVPETAPKIFGDVLSLVDKFNWRNEAVWHLVKTLMLMPAIRAGAEQGNRAKMMEVRARLRSEIDSQNLDAKVLDRVVTWLELHGSNN